MADQNGEGAQTTPVAPGADGQSGAATGGDGSQAAATSTLLTGGAHQRELQHLAKDEVLLA